MRIAPALPERCPWYLRPFFRRQKRVYGAVLDASLMWARVPRLFLAVAALYGAIDRRSSPVPPALRSLLTVRISQINHCAFCVDVNTKTLLERGIGEEKAHALAEWRTSPLFDERERAALDYAEAMTFSDRQVDDALMAQMKRHFDDDAVFDLTALIGFQNMSSKVNAALDVPAQGFCRLPGAT
jgi:AhpD family alkylhydroperoxidase